MTRPLLRAMATVSGFTMLSRVLGFARQMLLAGVLGAGGNPVADAFLAAFRLPNMFRRLLAEGAFQAAFVPLFQGAEARGDLAEAKRFAEDVLGWLVLILTGLTALVMIFAPIAVLTVAWGFKDDPERFDLTVFYTRIMFPYLACMSLVGLYGGMLNALERFAAAAAAPLLLNVALIGGLLLFKDAPAQTVGFAASVSVMVGGVLQLGALLFAARRASLLLRLRRPRLSAGARRMVTLGAPGFVAASALQVNGIVGTNVASRQDGAISWLFYADQLYQLPLAMIGIALGVVLMPAIGRAVKAGNEAGARETLGAGVETAMLFALPAAAALIAMPAFVALALFDELPAAILGASRFSANDAGQVGAALYVYAFGVPAFVLQKVLSAAFFAREDTRTPMRYALCAIAINAGLSIGLFPYLGFLSVPVGTVSASWAEVSLLAGTLGRRGLLGLRGRMVWRLTRMFALAGAMGWALSWAVANRDLAMPYVLGQSWLFLFVLTAAAAAAYLALALALGAVPLSRLRPARRTAA